MKRKHISILSLFACTALQLNALTLPNVFGDHMVFQREQVNTVWGTAEPSEAITVQIAGQSHSTQANEQGQWKLSIDPLASGGPYTLEVQGNEQSVTYTDVLSGEVWICSGQSNMRYPLSAINNAEIEIHSANYPEIRLLTVPNVGSPEALSNFNGQWVSCSPHTAARFSAVGYLFGRRLHNTLQVPIGLINNAWSGSSAEGWVPREVLDQHAEFNKNSAEWDAKVAAYSDEMHEQAVAAYKASRAKWKEDPQGPRPREPRDPRFSAHRPGNIFNGVVAPTVGFGIKGVIWYQGESNVARANTYQLLMTELIQTWRARWGQGDFPFYWVQLADHGEESAESTNSSLPALRDAQTKTLSVPHTGQAVIIDVGEGRDIHPRNKQTVANRLVRWALSQDYGYDQIAYQSPTYQSMKIQGNKVLLTFDYVSDQGLYTFDVDQALGFSIAGADNKFHTATARLVGNNQIEVSSKSILEPIKVSYGWSKNPVVNVYDRNGLPLTPFRTDR
jgi:sialate O-acetylesterase